MKWMKLAAAAAIAFAYGNAYAFHDGGAAECDGCHVMHNASGGTSKHTAQNAYNNLGNSYLLQGTDQSSTCLLCHSGPRTQYGATEQYHIANFDAATGVAGDTTQANYTPGGDFGWLKTTFTYQAWEGAPANSATSPGERHGHNIVAADFGLVADSKLPVAPGGTFAYGTGKAAFACSNCHDPHGRYRLQGTAASSTIVGGGASPGPSTIGTKIDPIVASGSYGQAPVAGEAVGVYRLLAGKLYAPVSNNAFPFSKDPPIAVAPANYNHPEYGGTASGEVRVAYGTGMSEWCQNCHTNIHLDAYVTGAPGLRHPAGSDAKFRQAQADIYNAYKGSGDLSATTQYTSIVPFETGVTDVSQLAAVASDSGAPGTGDTGILKASTSANVMCLSCHRAHASAFDSMVRWNMNNAFLVEDGSQTDPQLPMMGGKTPVQVAAGYYGRTAGNGFEAFQRSLCNKCHAKD